MTGTAERDYDVDRQRHVEAYAKDLPLEIDRVEAPRAELQRLRDERLRALLAHAREHSPWHRKRLASIDPGRISGDDLTAIPPMTKAELMTHWDEIVCDRRLSLAMADDHIERVARDGPAYLLDDYHALATGGTTGHRGVVVWDFEGFRLAGSRVPAWGMSTARLLDSAIPPPIVAANIGSQNTIHMGGSVTRCFSNSALLQIHSIGAATPIERIVERLEELQPDVLAGYASTLQELAEWKLSGRLDITPRAVNQGGEPFLPEAWEAIRKAFPVPIRDVWGSTEVGMAAASIQGWEGLAVSEDLVIVEPVDADGRPVPYGERAAKLFVTNLANRVLPVIRYEISDEVTLLPPAPDCPWHGARLSAIHGRQDDVFAYGDGRRIHPHTFRSVLTRHAAVAEYQVHQTARGARVLVLEQSGVDAGRLAQELETALASAGLEGPRVAIEPVESIPRHADSGKLKRFIRRG